jgi:polyferredoxin
MAILVHSEIDPTIPVPESAPVKPKKKFVRRTDNDYSQALRHSAQLLFLVLNIYLGIVFYFWVRGFEIGHPASLDRPPGVEGYLPIAGLMNLKYWLLTGHVPSLHPAAMFLLITFIAIAFFFRKAFCSWLCPVGTLSEYLWGLGRRLFRRNFRLPAWIDIPLRGLKYLLLGFFVWAVSSMSAATIDAFMHSPYGMIADVKMLDFFRDLGQVGGIVIAVLVLASIFIQNFWCRYLCPYGALLGISSLFSPLRIRRDSQSCIDCAKCAKACPSSLPVDKLVAIKSAECTACLECVAACPAAGALHASAALWPVPGRRVRILKLQPWFVAAGIALLFVGIVGFAKISGRWNSPVPAQIYQQLVPHANQASHPMPGDPELTR